MPKFFKLCPIVLNYVQQIFPGGKKFSRRSFAPPGYGPGRNRFTEHCTGQVARSTCSSSPSLHRYTRFSLRNCVVALRSCVVALRNSVVALRNCLVALRNCVVACFSFYGGGDNLLAPLGTRLHEKFAKELQKSQKVAKEPNENFRAKCFSKKPNFCFLAPKEPIWQPCSIMTQRQVGCCTLASGRKKGFSKKNT